jgi:hypothetical protein
MAKSIKILEVGETDVVVMKDTYINADRKSFKLVIRVATPFPHPKDKEVFFEHWYIDSLDCSDKADQELKFQKYNIDDAARFAGMVKKQYNNIVGGIPATGAIIRPGDVGFKLPFSS